MNNQFGRGHSLKSKKKIALLFSKGKRIHGSILTLIYHKVELGDESKELTQVLFSVPKRNFKKAVDRNLLKRRLREGYRMNVSSPFVSGKSSYQWYIAFVYKESRIRDFNDIKQAITLLLRKLEAKQAEL